MWVFWVVWFWVFVVWFLSDVWLVYVADERVMSRVVSRNKLFSLAVGPSGREIVVGKAGVRGCVQCAFRGGEAFEMRF